MTRIQYRRAIKALGLSQHRAADWLGIGRRTSQAYALGEVEVPKATALLFDLIDKAAAAGFAVELDARGRLVVTRVPLLGEGER